MDKWMKEGERSDDLMRNGMRLLQDPAGYCFTIDAVLLAHFARVGKSETVCDLGTGSGVILLLLAARNPGLKRGVGIEVQKHMADLAARNFLCNNMGDRLSAVHARAQDAQSYLEGGRVNVVVSNPPYRKRGSGALSADSAVAVCRHELALTLSELTQSASGILGTGGRFYLVYRADRLAELFHELYNSSLVPKTLRLVQAKPSASPHLALVAAVKNGGEGLSVRRTLVLSTEDGAETEELKQIYARRE